MNQRTHSSSNASRAINPRRAERWTVNMSGRLTWRDARGIPRFASVVTRDVSDGGVYLECRSGEPIPLYRLVYLQLERESGEPALLPPALRDGRVLSAVYRVGPSEPSTGAPSGYALRLLVDPGSLKAVDTHASQSMAS